MLVLAVLGAPSACGGADEGARPTGGSPPPSQAEPTPEAQDRPERDAGGAPGAEQEAGSAASGAGDPGAGSGGGGNAGGGRSEAYDPDRPDSPENDVPPPKGSPAERFERFCEENPQQCH